MELRMSQPLTLQSYRLLGRSGLRVSPLALGTMTFGIDWGWGADEAEARRIFDMYVDRGGNFIDTANQYTNGSSEQLLGQFATGKRDSLVLATKYTAATRPGDPNSGGNHRKSMVQSVETSLKRLKTDYIDLLYLHAWDFTTSVEEVLRAMDDLVRQGKVLYLGVSDIPAWQAARLQTMADLRGWSPLAALQIEYSLVERTVERDLIPMAAELGMGVLPWSPLASGVLTGKYTRADLGAAVSSDPVGTRRNVAAANGSLTERALNIADAIGEIAEQMGRTRAQVALAWTLLNPAVTAPILGVRTIAQLEDNLGSLEVTFNEAQIERLYAVSAIELGFPHDFLRQPMARYVVTGGVDVRPRV
jgi:aryl-alcohol dehydrogenase-like predicted oxidoreductase